MEEDEVIHDAVVVAVHDSIQELLEIVESSQKKAPPLALLSEPSEEDLKVKKITVKSDDTLNILHSRLLRKDPSSNTNAVKKQLMKARQRNMKVRLFEPKQQQQEQELQRQQQQQELGQQQLELQGLQQQELGQQQLELQGLQQPELQGLQQLELQGLQQQQRQRLQAHNAGCY
ncbi:uncharacterized protein DDB_G0285291-like isoform X1 [Microplitis demolitor]|uniref:uncharacterized protein DDB_G0285291-like isoform X1 n=1 Tax=Microplitis demolitor TaxID=69319 RepID=UPI00235B6CAD|nr:uncharacterized protein DDB_G0285291-like isoform X1 [Microplitis demolitor]